MEKDKLISVRLSPEDLDRLQRLADKAGITRHKFIVNLIRTGLDAVEDVESFGVVKLAIMARDMEKKVKSFMKGSQQEGQKKESIEG